MLARKIINRISIIVIAALSLLSKMLESLAPLLSKVLVIASAVCLVAFTVWAIVMLIRFGAPEEQKANCPKWVSNLFRVGALLIIIGAVLKVNLWQAVLSCFLLACLYVVEHMPIPLFYLLGNKN